MIEPACRVILANNQVIKDMAGDRITFGLAAQGELRPRIVLALITSEHEHTFTGHAGYVTGRIEAVCLAPSYPAVKTLAEAVITALDGFEGAVPGITGMNISYVTVDSENDIPAVVPDGAATPSTFGVSVEFNFMYATA